MVQKRRQFGLKSIIDVEWAGSIDDMKSTSGGAFFLGQIIVS